MSESEEEMRWDWLFLMDDNRNERVVLSYWPGRSAGENLAVFWGSGTALDRQYELDLVADITPDGGIHGHVIGQDGYCDINVDAGRYGTVCLWIDGRVMRRYESWNSSFRVNPSENKIFLVVNAPKM